MHDLPFALTSYPTVSRMVTGMHAHATLAVAAQVWGGRTKYAKGIRCLELRKDSCVCMTFRKTDFDFPEKPSVFSKIKLLPFSSPKFENYQKTKNRKNRSIN
jgi:hypothetical protein